MNACSNFKWCLGISGPIVDNLSNQSKNSRRLNPRRILRAVQKTSKSRWYTLGRSMGFDRNQLLYCTEGLIDASDKLEAVFDVKTQQLGEQRAAYVLMEACRAIESPTIGAVYDELRIDRK